MTGEVLLEVPAIDVAPFLAGTPEDRSQVAEQVDRACRDIGFLVITGHGVDLDLLTDWFAISRTFFALPEQYKRTLEPDPGDFHHGYHRIGGENLASTKALETPPDLREFFVLCRLEVNDPYYKAPRARRFYHPNFFPDPPPAFASIATRYYLEMERLGRIMMALFALALRLPETYFEDKIDRHFSALSTINYPGQEKPPLPGQLRAGEHSDYGSLTILAPSDAPGGLQVLNKAGGWVDVPYIPGAYVINVGDMMARWTNDRWVSTVHRVLNPPAGTAASSTRQSTAYFLHPNYDAVVECIPTCKDAGNRPKYPPILAGDHMWAMMNKIAPDLNARHAVE